jgi:cell division initiation protein
MATRLTAMDVESQQFERRMRGYDADDVRMYLRAVAAEIERLNLENSELLEELGQFKAQLDELRERERTLQRTLVTAQRMAEDLAERANKEAELVIKEARLKGEQIVRDARDEMAQLAADVSRSKLERDTFEQQLRGVIDQHLALLDLRRQARVGMDNVHNVRVMPTRVSSEAG